MAPSLCRGRCIRYFEARSNKKPYAVVLEIAGRFAIIARGTSREHPDDHLVVQIDVGEKGSSAWKPPLNALTRFYSFDIKRVELAVVEGADLGGLCRPDIFDRLATAMQDKLFVGGPDAPTHDEPE